MNYEVVSKQQDDFELWRVYNADNDSTDSDTVHDEDQGANVIASHNGASARSSSSSSSPLALEAVEQTEYMLSTQWPRPNAVAFYREKLVHSMGPDREYTLPASYLLVQRQQQRPDGNNDDGDSSAAINVLGHGRLTDCFEGAGGRAAAATYICVNAFSRGQGIGRTLMRMLEQQAKALQYHYVYLWTVAAVPFYQKLGYAETVRVSLHRACLKILAVEQVSVLESMLTAKLQAANSVNDGAATCIVPRETVTLPPPSDGMAQQDGDVWLRKRLVEFVGSINVPLQERLEEMRAAIRGCSAKHRHPQQSISSKCSWEYRLVRIQWQQQVGPSCGLAALRMLRDHYTTLTDGQAMPSLLTAAQEKDYSEDGEVFDAANLQDLAESECGLYSDMRLFSQVSMDNVLSALTEGSVWVLPYDSSPGTKLPGLLSGMNAHYGIIVGMLLAFESDSKDVASDEADVSVDELEPHDNRPASEACQVLLLVQHSLSRKLAIAPWSSFLASNQQLVSIDRNKFRAATNLNLADQLILVKGNHH